MRTLLLLCAAIVAGCSDSRTEPAPPQLNQVDEPAETEAREQVQSESIIADDQKKPDVVFMLDRLRDVVDREDLSEFSIGFSPADWSTFTAEVAPPMTADSAKAVWEKWTAHPTAITKPANGVIEAKVAEAVTMASEDGEAQLEFDHKGFTFEVNAQNGGTPDSTFVRISFIGAEFLNALNGN
ncbi:hypothetical protein FYK55_00875 [Roseiconus nitratireducens]|uniref:Lipoprotein n=1 Tax=Roseiconus nitratireducens TaxID=2605748 RepID=A0A5M6DHT1_9BACT|nr:hypothetical protein [Roseiconus nitratireducens]KAA5547003.1 hypothetical protein FYK55_00875 [Roseiconus nitratireducens]